MLLILLILFINLISLFAKDSILTYISDKAKKNESISILEFESELTKYNVDILYENENKTTICHVAAEAAPEFNNNIYLNLIEYIVSKKEESNIEEYINKQDNYGDTCVHRACFNGNIKIVRFLIEKGASVFINTNVGVNPLHSSAYKGHNEIVRYLITEHKVPINIETNSKGVPLHYAVGQNRDDIVLMLLELGANVNAVNKDGVSSLHIALKNNRTEIAKMLISNGAQFILKNKEGLKAIDYVKDNEIKTMLMTEFTSYSMGRKLDEDDTHNEL